jgi:putative Mn2+ efflux pump MntP
MAALKFALGIVLFLLSLLGTPLIYYIAQFGLVVLPLWVGGILIGFIGLYLVLRNDPFKPIQRKPKNEDQNS